MASRHSAITELIVAVTIITQVFAHVDGPFVKGSLSAMVVGAISMQASEVGLTVYNASVVPQLILPTCPMDDNGMCHP